MTQLFRGNSLPMLVIFLAVSSRIVSFFFSFDDPLFCFVVIFFLGLFHVHKLRSDSWPQTALCYNKKMSAVFCYYYY